jgi:hypothetical protein
MWISSNHSISQYAWDHMRSLSFWSSPTTSEWKETVSSISLYTNNMVVFNWGKSFQHKVYKWVISIP